MFQYIKFFPPFILKEHNLTIFVCGKSSVNVRLKSSSLLLFFCHSKSDVFRVSHSDVEYPHKWVHQKYLLCLICFTRDIFSNSFSLLVGQKENRILSDRTMKTCLKWINVDFFLSFFFYFFYSLLCSSHLDQKVYFEGKRQTENEKKLEKIKTATIVKKV